MGESLYGRNDINILDSKWYILFIFNYSANLFINQKGEMTAWKTHCKKLYKIWNGLLLENVA